MELKKDGPPELETVVLLFDSKYNKWRLASLHEKMGRLYWILDNKIFFSFSDQQTRFSHWVALPPKPA